MRFKVVLLCLVLTVVGCAQNTAPANPASSEVPAKAAHAIQEEAIFVCMKENGLEYTMVPFIETSNLGLRHFLILDRHDEIGYGATFGELLVPTTPIGAPPEELDQAELLAYDKALFGSGFDPETDDSGGCMAVGRDARLAVREEATFDVDSAESRAKAEELLERVVASESYLDFAEAWSACLREEGWSATDPLSHRAAISSEFSSRASIVLGHSLETPAEDLQVVASEVLDKAVESNGPLTDVATFQSYLDQLPPLAAIFEEELQAAAADVRCRSTNIDLMQSSLDDISLEIYGKPFGDLD